MFRPTVFDTGRLRPGGRCSSRFPGDRPKDDERQKTGILSKSLFDHAAQIITLDPDDTSEFAKQVAAWEEDGVLKRYPPDTVYDIVKEGATFSLRPLCDKLMYHGVRGMGSIPLAMAKDGQFPIEQDVWVSPSNGVEFLKAKNQWKVKGYKETFDNLVIAHNGKCADRLMSRTPAKALHSLLRVNFNPTVPQWGGKYMTLNSIYSLTVCIKGPSSLSDTLPSLIGGFVSDHNVLRFVSCQSRKYPREDDMEVWTILSSPKFAKRYKGPQENLPHDLVDEVTDSMIESLEGLLGLQTNSLRNSVIERRLQLWGAAVPLNTYGKDGFLWDANFHVGVCGDWLVDPSIAGAWESGRRLAEYMKEGPQKGSVGLPSSDRPAVFAASQSVSKAGIGSLQ
jgi:predicted NAD/FAD-dependent oxidoreductase